jgi:hypothetical protein
MNEIQNDHCVPAGGGGTVPELAVELPLPDNKSAASSFLGVVSIETV